MFRVHDAATGSERAPFRLAGAHVSACSSDGKRVALSNAYREKGSLAVWDVNTKKLLLDTEVRRGLWQMELSPEGNLLAEWRRPGGNLTLRNANTGEKLWLWREPGWANYSGMAFSPDGSKRLALVVMSGKPLLAKEVAILDVATGKVTDSIALPKPIETYRPMGLAWSPNGRSLAIAAAVNSGRLIQSVDLTTRKGWHRLLPCPNIYFAPMVNRGLAYSPDSKTLVCPDRGPMAPGQPLPAFRFLDSSTGKEQFKLTDVVPADSLAFSPNGDRLVAANTSGGIMLRTTLKTRKMAQPD